MKYICTACKQESDLPLYFYDAQIVKDAYLPDPSRTDYYASVKVKGVCPYCGSLINNTVRKFISHDDIIQFIKEE